MLSTSSSLPHLAVVAILVDLEEKCVLLSVHLSQNLEHVQMVGRVALVVWFRELFPPSLALFVRGSPYSTVAFTFRRSGDMAAGPLSQFVSQYH